MHCITVTKGKIGSSEPSGSIYLPVLALSNYSVQLYILSCKGKSKRLIIYKMLFYM